LLLIVANDFRDQYARAREARDALLSTFKFDAPAAAEMRMRQSLTCFLSWKNSRLIHIAASLKQTKAFSARARSAAFGC
jgi:hypothetical protein